MPRLDATTLVVRQQFSISLLRLRQVSLRHLRPCFGDERKQGCPLSRSRSSLSARKMGSCWDHGVVVSWKRGRGRVSAGWTGRPRNEEHSSLLYEVWRLRRREVGWARFLRSRDRGARRRRRRQRRRRLAMVNASRVKVGGDGLSSACKYFTLHSSQFSFRLGVSQSHNFASTLSGSDTHPLLFTRRLVPLSANT